MDAARVRSTAQRLRRPAAAVLLFTLVVWGTRIWRRSPDVAPLALHNPTTTALIDFERAASGSAAPLWEWVDLADISPHLVRAVLVAEDINFFTHAGFAWDELRLVAGEVLRDGGALRGASTITQQLAKNLWLSPERTMWRKAKEALLTLELEHALSKRRILEVYLNVVAFGPGVYGAGAAARAYFGKAALYLTERESAMLAAALSRPSRWNPTVATQDYLDRVDLVERRTARAEFLWRHVLGF